MEKVYLETSFVSYLAARPSRELIMAGNQQITRDWWEFRRERYDLYLSQRVLDEIECGDPLAASERMRIVQDIPLLAIDSQIVVLAKELLFQGPFPERAEDDAIHVATATVHGIDYLLTWNCKHIANAEFIRDSEIICQSKGYKLPVICTPAELMGI
ncbi:MAG: type II toxin-antitoxin system VapC family toxin [Pirellulales bacterium]|nr:type II toxin-antitoxin system VapC family toxin [Pirellulales bacterium]